MENLKKAAALLRKHGWCQWRAVDGNGGMCVVAALSMSTTGSAKSSAVLDTPEYKELVRRTGSRYVADWNDEPSRTYEEVLALLEA